jgi:CheY-like chemotaxis protein
MMRDPVLLVEPDEQRRSFDRWVLERAGYSVVEARTGEEAIWTVCRERPCTVVMECSVPGVSGLRAAEVLKGEPELRHVPILLLASAGDADEKRRAHAAGCDAYLAEPRSPDALLEAVRRLTGSERTREGGEGHSDGPDGDAGRAAGQSLWIEERMRETWAGLRQA